MKTVVAVASSRKEILREVAANIRPSLEKTREELKRHNEQMKDASFKLVRSHPADSEMPDEVVSQQRGHALIKRVKELESAMFRVLRGQYDGLCEECGEEIPVKRLQMMPHTTLCCTCKELQEEEGGGLI